MRITKLALLIFSTLFFVSFFVFKKEAIACEVITLSNFKESRLNIFIDDTLSRDQQALLFNQIEQAYNRVSHVYGSVISSPRIIATTDVRYERFGLNLTGMQSSGFFRECIFLGPKGLNVDVIAHELVHAEVRHRSNMLTEFTQLPAWFIEGAAIKVDYRRPFLLENIELTNDEVEQIKSIFFLHSFPNSSVKSYQAARVAIEELEPKSLYSGLIRLNNGEAFDDVFFVD